MHLDRQYSESYVRQQEIQARCYHETGNWHQPSVEEFLQPLPHRFEQIAERYPNKLAVKVGEQTLTYSQLNKLANQLAHCLLATKRDNTLPTAILLEHGIPSVIAILGVMKSGGFCLVLDPSYPTQKLATLLENAGNGTLVTSEAYLARAKEFENTATAILNLSQDGVGFPNTNPEVTLPLDSLAYLIYTSGTTGDPKGIMLPHRMLGYNILSYTNGLHICAEDRIANVHKCAFASSISEIFTALLTGATLYPWDFATDGYTGLREMLKEEGVTVLNWGATPFRHFTTLLTPGDLPSLRVLMLGNEAVLRGDIDLYKRYCDDKTILIQRCGSTEAGNFSRLYVDKSTLLEEQTVPAGYITERQEVAILDENGIELGPNQVGEIAVRSEGLMARGYWRLPEGTKERFLPATESTKPTFLTGDMGLLRPDGCLYVLGRKDFQVKIRGHRIEIGEIENVLSALEGIQDVAVISEKDEIGETLLVAYLVPEPQNNLDLSRVRAALQEKLPRNMIPAKFYQIDKMPLTSTGKPDRRALTNANATALLTLSSSHKAPETARQYFLYTQWQAILGTTDFGIDDSFFALGGDSLKAAILNNRILQKTGCFLSLTTVFEYPTIAQLSRYLEEHHSEASESLSAPKRLAPMLEPAESFVTSTSQKGYRLSFAQERLWFLQQLAPESAAYNLCSAWSLEGELHTVALLQSLQEIVRRHSLLRALFQWEADHVLQIVQPLEAYSTEEADLRNLPLEEAEKSLQKIQHTVLNRPYDLGKELPFRAILVRVTDTQHTLVIGCHHIVWDAWSQDVFRRELSQLYQAFSQETASPIAVPAFQYCDYAQWQRRSIQDDQIKPQIAYWLEQLKNTPQLQLPTDYPTSPIQTYAGASVDFAFSPELTSAIKTLSKAQNTTLFMTLFAAFSTLLYRYTGQEDFAIGVPIVSRAWAESEDLIGCFLNTLALRTHLSPESSFKSLLMQTRKTTLDAFTHQEVPFEQLVEILQPERTPSTTPLFQVLFQLQNTPLQPLTLLGLESRPLPIQIETAQFDLSVAMREEAGGLIGRMYYNTDLFLKERIERAVTHFENLLVSATSDPETPLQSLTLLSQAEHDHLVNAWNATEVEWSQEDYTTLFEAQVEQTPDAIAVVFEEERLTYRELNYRANQLAHHLQAQGVGFDTIVGLCVERSLDLLIGFLGILKAGGAYLPLSPNYPKERLAYILEDTQIPVLITHSRLRQHLPKTEAQCLSLDTDATQIGAQSRENIQNKALPYHLAYVIYTSGTTGNPKGVLVERKGMLNHIRAKIQDLNIRGADHILQTASQSFDIAIWQLLTALLVGGETHIASEETASDPALLFSYCKRNHISLLEVVPSFLNLLLEVDVQDMVQEPFETLRWLISTGEALPPALCRHWFERFPQIPLMNAYGPTECSDRVSHYALFAPPSATVRHLPIGRPIANTQIYLLDDGLQPVPIGVKGEVVVGGLGVARGYLYRPEETATRFVANPFGAGRLYRTGDSARFLPDGNIEFLGRNDNQIKLHGFRIELGEIETVLGQHPALRRAIVTLHQRDKGVQEIIAYTLPHTNKQTTPQDLKQCLQEKLPAYMIPTQFVSLKTVPMTARGKLDYAALPAPESVEETTESQETQATDLLELLLVRIWQKVLGVKTIDVQTSFFDLGGNSLLAIRLFDQIQKLTGVRLPVATLFQYPTIAHLAEIVRKDHNDPTWTSVAPIHPTGDKTPIYFVPPPASTVLKIAGITQHLSKDRPVFGLEYLGLHEGETPHQTVEEMASYFVEQICRLQPEGPYIVGGFCFGSLVALEMAQQLERQGREVALLVLVGAGHPHSGPTWQPPKRFSSEHWKVLNEYWREWGFGPWLSEYTQEKYRGLKRRIVKQPEPIRRTFQAYTQAYFQYRPTYYRGRFLLIQTEDFAIDFIRKKWDVLGVGEYECVVVKGVRHIHSLYQEPYTQEIAGILDQRLSELDEQKQ